MSIIQTYILPVASSTEFGRSSSLVSFTPPLSGQTALALADYETDAWYFSDGSTLAATPGLSGIVDASVDGISGFYLLGRVGPLIHIASSTSAISGISLPTSSKAYTGVSYNLTDHLLYIIGMDGAVYKYNGSSAVSSVAAAPSGISQPARWLYNDGSNLYSLFSTSNKFGKFSLSSKTWTFTASPFTATLDALFYSASAGKVMVGGSNKSSIHDASSILSIEYASKSNQLAVLDAATNVKIYNFTGGGWSLVQTISGPANPVTMAATPDGTQILVIDSTDNSMQVLTSVGGTWSQTQSLSVTNPVALATFSGSGFGQAFVCQQSVNQISIYNRSGITWTVGPLISVTAPTSIALNQSSTIPGRTLTTSVGIVGQTGGITFLSYNGSAWVVAGSISMAKPVAVATDSLSLTNSYTYAVTTSGGNSTVYIFNGIVIAQQYTFSGTATGIEVVNGLIIVPTLTGAINIAYNLIGDGFVNVVNSAVAPSSGASLAWVPEIGTASLLAISGQNDVYSFYFDTIKSLVPVTETQVAVLSGASWLSTDILDESRVASITTDLIGNIFAITNNNNLSKFTAGSSVLAGYPYIILPPTGQEEFIPLGFSKLVYVNGSLWAASSLLGGIVKLTNL